MSNEFFVSIFIDIVPLLQFYRISYICPLVFVSLFRLDGCQLVIATTKLPALPLNEKTMLHDDLPLLDPASRRCNMFNRISADFINTIIFYV